MPQAPGSRRPATPWPLVAGWLAFALFMTGCSSPPPTPEEAARALLASEPFRVARLETAAAEAPGPCQEAINHHPEWSRWTSLGIARVSTVVTTAGAVCRLAVEETYWREAENWSHRAPPQASSAQTEIKLPVAVRSLLRVSEIRSLGNGVAEAAFEWQWRLNQAGQRFGIDTRPLRGWAQLVRDESQWRAMRIELGGQ